MVRSHRVWVAVAVLYTAITAFMVWPYANFRALGSAGYSGDARLIAWTLAWDNHAVLNGLPLFDSNMYYPTSGSLAYTEHLLGISLFTLPIYAATKNPLLAYNVVWLLSFLLNALATHVLVKRLTRSHLAAIAGSLIFTFSFYKMLHAHGHLQQIWTWLVPLSIVCLERWRERPTFTRAVLWAATVVLQALSSWYLALMMILLQAVALAAILPGAWKDRRPLAGVVQLLAVTALAAAIVAPIARPYRVIPETSVAEAVRNSADLRAYVVPPENTWVGQVWLARVGPGPRWIWGERTLFVGWLALAFAMVGVVDVCRSGRWRVLALYGTIAIAGLALSFGPSVSPSGESWSAFSTLMALPGIGAFRAPARFALLVLLGVSVFAAFGVVLITRSGSLARMAVAAALPIMLSEWYVVKFPGGKPQPSPIPAIYRHEQLKSARALVSLPAYRATRAWYYATDYLYYSSAHWRPIVNGYGRADPPGFRSRLSHAMAFPGPNNARSMRELGVEYIVVHAGRYPDGAKAMIEEALASPEYRLVAREGSDYLFAVRPARDARRLSADVSARGGPDM